VHKIVDMKPPGSGEVERNHFENLALLGDRDELKFVLAGREDYEWSLALMSANPIWNTVRAVTFSPVHGLLDPAELSAWLIEDRVPARLGLQLHKAIWPEAMMGV
ncbi:MAG: 7-carboxy-7-deazaguanine synthase QueE, partial [Myxococcales bacterium]|nr:7-carboxy-7-deazaguanine synthase QueE [Myxococcales bacterium]